MLKEEDVAMQDLTLLVLDLTLLAAGPHALSNTARFSVPKEKHRENQECKSQGKENNCDANKYCGH